QTSARIGGIANRPQFAINLGGFLELAFGKGQITLRNSVSAHVVERVGNGRAIAKLTVNRQGLFIEQARSRIIAIIASQEGQVKENGRNAGPMPQLLIDGETFIEIVARRLIVPLVHTDKTEVVESARQ